KRFQLMCRGHCGLGGGACKYYRAGERSGTINEIRRPPAGGVERPKQRLFGFTITVVGWIGARQQILIVDRRLGFSVLCSVEEAVRRRTRRRHIQMGSDRK